MRGNSETFPTFSLTQHFSVSFFVFLFRNCKRARPPKYHLKKANWIGKTFRFSSSFPAAIFLLEIQITGNFSSTSERQDRFRTRNRFRVGIFTCFTFFFVFYSNDTWKTFPPSSVVSWQSFWSSEKLKLAKFGNSFLPVHLRTNKKENSSIKSLRRILILSRKNSHSHTQAPQAAWPPHEDTSPPSTHHPQKATTDTYAHKHTRARDDATAPPPVASTTRAEVKWGAPMCGVLFFPWKSAANWVSVPSDSWGKGPRLRAVRSATVLMRCARCCERGDSVTGRTEEPLSEEEKLKLRES